uniref:Uncharacterized protein n=1 Tax=Rhizophora mucronata TaxID=61149 RepID=A0A2P2Q3V4_RHIMU
MTPLARAHFDLTWTYSPMPRPTRSETPASTFELRNLKI